VGSQVEDGLATLWRFVWKLSGESAQLNTIQAAINSGAARGALHGSKRNSDLIAVARITRRGSKRARSSPPCELIRCWLPRRCTAV